MRDFWKLLKRYALPYKRYIGGAVVLNVLSAIFNIFSFTLIIPILKILFGLSAATYSFIPWDQAGLSFKEIALNNIYFYVTGWIAAYGGSRVLFLLGIFLGVMTAVKTACYFGSTAVMVPLRTGIIRDIRIEVYGKLLSLPLSFYSQKRKGDVISRITSDVNEVETSITSCLDMLLKNPILIIFYFATLVYTSWQLTLFTLIVVPVMVWCMSAVGRRLKRQSLEAQSWWSTIMTQMEETLGGMRVIKAFLAEGKMRERFSENTATYRRLRSRVMVRQSLAHPMSEFLGTVMIMIVLWFGGTLILSESSVIDAPTFIFYMVILYSILAPLKDFAKASYNIPKGMASMERVDEILLADNPITEKADAVGKDSVEDCIEFRGVCFSYEEGKPVLTDIDLRVPKGRTVALVGQSGSGKSTLVDLLPRFRDVDSGSITIDGTDIRDMKVASLRHLIGNVDQEAVLFNDTIFNNIAFGVENATMEDVVAAAKIANAHEFIMEKEKGYDTVVGDRGAMLSGGQRQRISIARAILKNPEILILDEATSALDTKSEKLVQEALDRLTSTRTTIAIAHRLSTIRNADEICVLHEGRIVERGRHEELLALNGYYRKLNDMQAL